MTKKVINDATLEAIADAIRDKNGSSDEYTPLEMPQAIEDIQTGGAEKKDVNFYDYDGTLLYTYTADEFANITEMPENPTHEGLIAQGWNWDLAEAKEYVANWGRLIIGQSYITDNGATRVYVDLDEYSLEPYLGINFYGDIAIDWGDGSSEETVHSTSSATTFTPHIYEEPGSYVIQIYPIDDTPILIEYSSGANNNSNLLARSKFANANKDTTYPMAVKKIEIGKNFCWRNSNYGSFNNLYNLEAITIPLDTFIHTRNGHMLFMSFNNCKKLKCLIIPKGITTYGEYAVASCNNLTTLSLPQTSENISSGNAFRDNTKLEEITVPDMDATKFTNQSIFQNCYSLKRAIVPNYTSNCFQNCYNLEKVVLTNAENVVITSGSFSNNYCLSELHMPSSTISTNLGSNTISNSYYLEHLEIPEGITNTYESSLPGLTALKTIVFPSTVVSINSSTINNCFSLRELHIKATEPPTLSGTFSTLPDTCKIYVPQGSLEAYQTATNWSTYASQMEEE